ncbi:MAG: DUF3455 domain-containing protein [Polyangiaceae bacterium]
MPAATLYNNACEVAGQHSAGPHWVASDGSLIKGTPVAGHAVVVNGSIPLLLLSTAAEGTATGVLTNVTAVQRLATTGGAVPTGTCTSANVGAVVAAPYTATYYFYSGANIIPAL